MEFILGLLGKWKAYLIAAGLVLVSIMAALIEGYRKGATAGADHIKAASAAAVQKAEVQAQKSDQKVDSKSDDEVLADLENKWTRKESPKV